MGEYIHDTKLCQVSLDEQFLVKSINANSDKFNNIVKGSNLLIKIHPNDMSLFFQNTAMFKETSSCTVRLKSDSNDYTWVLLIISKIINNLGNIEYLMDIYQSNPPKGYNYSLEDISNKYRTILSFLRGFIFEYNTKTSVIKLFCLKNSKEIFVDELSLCEWRDKMFKNNFIPSKSADKFSKFCLELEKGVSSLFFQFPSSIISSGKYTQLTQIKATSIINCNDSNFNIIGTITSENPIIIKNNSKNSALNTLDPLTSTLNKQSVNNYISERISQNKETTLIIMDVDFFKDINDNFGHLFGDDVLITISNILKTLTGNKGVVSRFGGDEFLIVLNRILEERELREFLRKIRSNLHDVYLEKLNLKLSASFGIASYPKDTDCYTDLFKLADKCLYIAKEKGRNKYIIYTPKKHGTVEKMISKSTDIKIKKSQVDDNCLNLCSIIDEFGFNKENDINNLTNSLFQDYSIERVTIFCLKTEEIVYDKNERNRPDNHIILYLSKKYADLFNDNDTWIINNILNIEQSCPDLYSFMEKNKIGCMFLYNVYKDNKIKYVIVLSAYSILKKWNKYDEMLLTIICRLLSKLI